MSDGRLSRILQNIADEALPPDEVNLWPGVLKELESGTASTAPNCPLARRRIAVPILLALGVLVASLLLVGPERVLAALRGLLGYVPGVGIVDETGGLRVLAEPVALERSSITITIDQVVVDLDQTVIVYEVVGVPRRALPRNEDDPGCVSPAEVRTYGGSFTIREGSGLGGWGSAYRARLVFDAIPDYVDEFTLMIPCLQGTRAGAAPENWEFLLKLVPAPSGFVVAPVIEIENTGEVTPAAPRPSGMGLYLERVIHLEDSYVLIGTFRQAGELRDAVVHGIAEWPTIEDANGYIIPIETPADLDLSSTEAGVFPWAYQVPKGFASPLTITLDAVSIEFQADTDFEFDAGPNPQLGDEWALNQRMEVAGYELRLIKAVKQDHGYEFHFESDSSVFGASVIDVDHQPVAGGGGGQQGEFSVAFEYAEPVPSGSLQFAIRGLFVRFPGPWTLTWAPPAGGQPAATLAAPQACLALERWLQIVDDLPELPAAISGKLVVFGQIKDDGQPQSADNTGVFIVQLRSATRQILGSGFWPALSPDGTKVAYSLQDGLHLTDLATGKDYRVPTTAVGDFRPMWSPDGAEIAFMRSDDFNLYIMNSDGSNIRRVTEGPEYEQLVGWMPDGHTLAYILTEANGEMPLRFVDLISGDVRDGFELGTRKGLDAAISQDGKMIAYSGLVPGRMGYGLYVSNVGGSGTTLIAHLDNRDVGYPVWSPDGEWLAVSVFDPAGDKPWPTPALIGLTKCDAFSVLGVDGQVFGWAP